MTKLKMALAFLAVFIFGTLALAQGVGGSGFWPNWPIVGQGSYCGSTTNSVCTQTIPAGPTALTGQETVPANTGVGNGATANVNIPVGTLGGNPIAVVSVTSSSPAGISASNLDGGVIYDATGVITAANITLPLNPIQGQIYRISATKTITTLVVAAASGDTLAQTTPTVLTPSATVPQGYTFWYNATSNKWYRLQ